MFAINGNKLKMKYIEQENILNRYIENIKNEIDLFCEKKDFVSVLYKINKLVNIYYNYNQQFRDDFLENALKKLVNNIKVNFKPNQSKYDILFYDGFGFDVRNLAQIYIEAFGVLNLRIIYITYSRVKNKQPNLLEILNKYDAKILYLPENNFLEQYYAFINLMDELPKVSFFLSGPHEIVGVLAFMKFEGLTKRYFINNADHLFWLGVNAFDYYLEFRNVGASISLKYRKIDAKKLLIQPYYPNLNKNIAFQGFPFKKESNDFIIFSGGLLYKTFDNSLTYYKLIEFCLNCSKNTKFWYAGTGDTSEINKLCDLYPNRVFYTTERADLYKIMLNIDMYMDTYPVGGGLMLQFAAMAGHATFSLCEDDFNNDILINGNHLIFNNIDEYKSNLKKYIIDNNFRKKIDNSIKNSVITKEQFENNLNNIIRNNKSNFLLEFPEINISINTRKYYNNFFSNGYYTSIFNKRNLVEKHNYRNKLFYEFTQSWLELKISGQSLDNYLYDEGYKNIAIYGFGKNGHLFYKDILNSKIQVIFAIDKLANEKKEKESIPILSLIDDLPIVDAVIVCVIDEFYQIYNELKNKVNCPILSLYDIIGEAMLHNK